MALDVGGSSGCDQFRKAATAQFAVDPAIDFRFGSLLGSLARRVASVRKSHGEFRGA